MAHTSTNNHRARKALSEIPMIMGRLSVTMDGDEQPVNYPIIVDVDNISREYFSPTTSPEEYVIRQRGRRSVSIAWSPEKPNCTKNKPLSNKALSVTAPASTTTMVLRSSPRKRLHLEMTPTKTTPTKIPMTNQRGTPKRTPDKSTASPASSTAHHYNNNSNSNNNNNNTTPNKNYYPTISKRLRFDEKPIVQLIENSSVMVLLRGLTNDQLIEIIHGCIQKEPQLEEHIRMKLPMADIKPMEEQLKLCKRNILKSLSYQRDVQKSDSKEYGRALSHLMLFKQCINDHCERLNQSKHWDALLDYILMAWSHVRDTPIWTNNAHNLIRKRCFKILTWHCTIALKCGKYDLGERRINHFADSITKMINDYDDIHVCQDHLQQLLNCYKRV